MPQIAPLVGGSLRLTMEYTGIGDGDRVDVYQNPAAAGNRREFLSNAALADSFVLGQNYLASYSLHTSPNTASLEPSLTAGNNEFLIHPQGNGVAFFRFRVEWANGESNVVPLDTFVMTVRDAADMYSVASARGNGTPTQQFDYPTEDGRVIEDMLTFPWTFVRDNHDHNVKKTLVYIHGFNNDEEDAEVFFKEVYKRSYWQGFRGNFVGCTWFGDDNWPNPLWFSRDVTNALHTSPALLDMLRLMQTPTSQGDGAYPVTMWISWRTVSGTW